MGSELHTAPGEVDRPLESIVAHVGNTPLVRLSRCLPPLPGVELYAKLEWFNPGGSVKDRAASRMMLEARRAGRMGPDRPLVDSTSGNTGVAYAMTGAAIGQPVALVMPANVSAARKRLTTAFGARLQFTDPMEQSDGAIREVRRRVAEEPESWFYPDQYSNPDNPAAHRDGTAQELVEQTRGRITHFVAGLGTSGTLMGTMQGLRERLPHVTCVAVEPTDPFHGLEGLKHMASSIVPAIYDASLPDVHLAITTDDGWAWAEKVAREEGLLAGHSAGAALAAAVQVAQGLVRDGREGVVVALFPDRADRYYEPPARPPARPPPW